MKKTSGSRIRTTPRNAATKASRASTGHSARKTPKFDFQTLEPRAMLAAGLLGQYFDQIDLTELVQERVDTKVEFPNPYAGSPPDIGNAPPGTSVSADDEWSIRWTGSVLIDTPGDWTFHTDSNDGVRLSIDNGLVIDEWNQHAVRRDSGTVTLDAGWHAIQLDYFQEGGTAAIRLLYEGPGQAITVIPSTHLDSVSVAPPIVTTPGVYDEQNGLVIMESENTSSDLGLWRSKPSTQTLRVTVTFSSPVTIPPAALQIRLSSIASRSIARACIF